MALDDKDWRPITFEGITFPPTVMGISILTVIPSAQPEMCDWLWSLRICCGVTKSADADLCYRASSLALELIKKERQVVLAEIEKRLGPHGFDPNTTLDDWVAALQSVNDISQSADHPCEWSAPIHPSDPIQNAADARRFFRQLESWFRNPRKK
jgi:hypothetical protein